MATGTAMAAAVDIGEGRGSATNGGVKSADHDDARNISMNTREIEEAAVQKPSSRPLLSMNIAPGPPNLHPTITTWQWLFSASDMAYTPSVIHSGCSVEHEQYLRWKGTQLIFRIAEYLRLGNHVMSTAAIYFHRFFMRRAFAKDVRERRLDNFTFQELAPTCLFLASKAEETNRKLSLIVEATMAVLDRSPQGMELAESRCYRPDPQSREYGRWKDIILLYEERLLETLCFDLIIEQPQPIAIKACRRLDTSRDMAQLTIVLLNSLSYGAVSIFYDAATLAAGAFQKACTLVGVDPAGYTKHLQPKETWYDLFDVDPEEVDEAMIDIEEHLAYHDERISQSRPVLTTASVPNTITPTTPLDTDADISTIVAPPLQQEQLHSSFQDNGVELKQGGDHNQNLAEGILPITPDRIEQIGIGQAADSSVIEREIRTDVMRPMSRHGSKGANRIGPPPPMDVQREESVTVPEQAAALKVHYEQLQQESTMQDDPRRAEAGEDREVKRARVERVNEQAEEGQVEEGELESEEEGAL